MIVAVSRSNLSNFSGKQVNRQLVSLSTRQHVCVDCKKNYCSRCSAQLELRPRLCHTCQRFYGNLLVRAELMKLKVKELRDYLHLHEVSTHLCREKVVYYVNTEKKQTISEILTSDPYPVTRVFPVLQEELVELVLCQQSSPSSDSAPETPITDSSTLTTDTPELNPHISTYTPDPSTPTSEPPAEQSETSALPTDTAPTERDVQDDDQVKLEKES